MDQEPLLDQNERPGKVEPSQNDPSPGIELHHQSEKTLHAEPEEHDLSLDMCSENGRQSQDLPIESHNCTVAENGVNDGEGELDRSRSSQTDLIVRFPTVVENLKSGNVDSPITSGNSEIDEHHDVEEKDIIFKVDKENHNSNMACFDSEKQQTHGEEQRSRTIETWLMSQDGTFSADQEFWWALEKEMMDSTIKARSGTTTQTLATTDPAHPVILTIEELRMLIMWHLTNVTNDTMKEFMQSFDTSQFFETHDPSELEVEIASALVKAEIPDPSELEVEIASALVKAETPDPSELGVETASTLVKEEAHDPSELGVEATGALAKDNAAPEMGVVAVGSMDLEQRNESVEIGGS